MSGKAWKWPVLFGFHITVQEMSSTSAQDRHRLLPGVLVQSELGPWWSQLVQQLGAARAPSASGLRSSRLRIHWCLSSKQR